MTPTLCILGGCNGAGKTTLARELLPRLGLKRFLNADEIARGLSPLDPSLSAFKAGRLLLEEARSLIESKACFAIESTLSGKTYLALIREARARGYRFLLHDIVIDSGTQAVARVSLRVKLGGHHVPEQDVQRRFDRSRRHFITDYLPLADEWVLWDNSVPPHRRIADSDTPPRTTPGHDDNVQCSGSAPYRNVGNGSHRSRSQPCGDREDARLLPPHGHPGDPADDPLGRGAGRGNPVMMQPIKISPASLVG
jgi:predicted ABC-type ATPase